MMNLVCDSDVRTRAPVMMTQPGLSFGDLDSALDSGDLSDLDLRTDDSTRILKCTT